MDRYDRMILANRLEKAWARKLPRYVEDHPVFMYRYDFGYCWKRVGHVHRKMLAAQEAMRTFYK
ncbi:hypothetical protein [Lentibacillus salinarum]|uniref:Uncharacterized protein n=1 Tax=Lentibacillus salinarum TaxID=446820 RepID=A0ABW3ZU98_9BACI